MLALIPPHPLNIHGVHEDNFIFQIGLANTLRAGLCGVRLPLEARDFLSSPKV
jgi:hypothetical protein